MNVPLPSNAVVTKTTEIHQSLKNAWTNTVAVSITEM
jgi:hypothetical protein